MNSASFYKTLIKHFPFEPTLKQDVFFQKVAEFILHRSNDQIFILKGYAGTGKTSIISTLVNQLVNVEKKYILLAPTGRAAKVIANYSQKPAFTIHKRIYFPKKNKSGAVAFTMQQNKFKNTVFIVDESSMISDTNQDSKLYENGSLLDDLLFYIDSGNNCKLILVGDTAQLPPVNLDVSPALNVDTMSLHYNKDVVHLELDEVMRQSEFSGILYNATELRSLLKSVFIDQFRFRLQGFNDIVRLQDSYETLDAIMDSFQNNGAEETAFIVRSNKRANQYNMQIRAKILDRESELSVGDLLMVVKNNYFWLKENSEAGFIANGDIIEVMRIRSIDELYGFKFATVTIRMVDYPNQPPFETVLLLDTISSESPSLTYEESNQLYNEVMKDFEEERHQYRKFLKVKNSPHFNALQVKFSYAITCHKSQGGQWNTVFIEQPYLPNGVDKEYVRWLYTALTRAKQKVYLIGFKDDFFEN
ncbi:ATP-dependent endonuclease [Flavobacterium sediminis]|uniref:ATP-dependent endonuclease n=1 Tax=Flavobacterium sediminis TaxID=2201181 RepID=A0A2U8QZ96_9FLAO|nr:AAA family ATPase [Flavobacterium sediminis]AWM15369.1 ATP-dependent endonuclease [Flavobacterium sediminis]